VTYGCTGGTGAHGARDTPHSASPPGNARFSRRANTFRVPPAAAKQLHSPPTLSHARLLGVLLQIRPRLHVHRVVRVRHHLHRRRQGHSAVPRVPHRATGGERGLRGRGVPAAGRQPAESNPPQRVPGSAQVRRTTPLNPTTPDTTHTSPTSPTTAHAFLHLTPSCPFLCCTRLVGLPQAATHSIFS
jgi:hypothetical protein